MTWPDYDVTNDAQAQSAFQSAAAANAITAIGSGNLSALGQLQLAVADLLLGDSPISGTPAADVSSGTFGSSIVDTGTYKFPTELQVGTAAGSVGILSSYTASGSDAAAGNITIKGPVSTGSATPGTIIFQTTNVGSTGSTAQTLATILTLGDATITAASAITITGSAASPAGTVRYIASPNAGTTDLNANVPSGANHIWRLGGTQTVTFTNATFSFGQAGALFSIGGRTTALTADAASGTISFQANVGTGAGAVGGIVFKVPVTHGSDSVAQTLTPVLTLGATTVVTAVFAGSLRAPNIGIAKAPTSTSPLCITGLPTSSAGLATGDVWANSNVLTIIP